MRRKVSGLLVGVLCAAVMAGCGNSGPGVTGKTESGEVKSESGKSDSAKSDSAKSGEQGKTVRLVIGSGPMGGALYPIAGGIAALINEYVDGGNASVQVTAGGVENTRMIGNGEIDLGLSSAQQCYDAINGSGIYEGEDLQLNVLGTLHSTVTQIAVLADSGLKDVQDLKGKKVAIGEAGGGAEQQFRELISGLGWSEDDVDMVYLPYDQAMDQLGDGLIDAGVVCSGMPASSISNLASRRKVSLLNFDAAAQEGWSSSVDPFLNVFIPIPAGTYSGMEQDISTSAAYIQLSCRADLDEDLAYEITKAIYDHLDELSTYHASAATITRESAPKISGAEFNPGAKRYFEEEGLLQN